MRYRVQELAERAGTTVRNVRAYRERGLLHAPALAGRTGWYDDSHLARLRLITRLLERGYSLGNIAELLAAWEADRPVADVIGIESVVMRSRSPEEPVVGDRARVEELLRTPLTEWLQARLMQTGLLEPMDGGSWRIPRPSLFGIVANLCEAGLPIDVVLDLGERMLASLDDVAAAFVETASVTLYGEDRRSEHPDLDAFDRQVSALLALADAAVAAGFGWCLERQLATELGRRVARHQVAEAAG